MDDFVPLPGHNTRHTLLNVVRSKGPGRVRDSVLIDNLETRAETGQVVEHETRSLLRTKCITRIIFKAFDDSDRFYILEDFDVGAVIRVGGRELVIYDADEFTKAFFAEHLNTGYKVQ